MEETALTDVSADRLLSGYLYVTYESIILNFIVVDETYKSNDISCKAPLRL